MRRIVFIGSGAIATALGDVLAEKGADEVTLLSIENEVIDMINNNHVNTLYFPKCRLFENLTATADKNVLGDADVIFLAIPSNAVVNYIIENQGFINPSALVVNLAKGFGNNGNIIPDCVKAIIPSPRDLSTSRMPSSA